MRVSKKIVAMVLAIAMLVMTTACGSAVISGGGTTWVYRVGEESVSAGHYITSQLVELSSFMGQVDEKLTFETGKEPKNFKEILALEIDGQTGYQAVELGVKEHCETYFAVLSEFARLGESLAPNVEAELDTYVGQGFDNEKEYFEMNGISRQSYLEYNRDSVRRDELFNALYAEGGEKAPTPKELEDVFLADFAIAGIIQLNAHSHGEEELSEEDSLAHIRELANEYLERVKAGESVESLQYEYEMEATAVENQESVQELPEGMLSLVVSEYTLDTYSQNNLEGIAQQVIDSKGKEPLLFEEEGVVTIIAPKELQADNENFEYFRPIILDNMKADEFDAHLVAVAAGLDILVNEKAVKRYTPDKIKEQPSSGNQQQQQQPLTDEDLADFDLADLQ